jgi:MSHA biogenesis protein MshO
MSARPRGITLLELIVVIVLMGVIGSTIGMFIVPMMQSYQAVAQRAELVDSAESALRRIGRDIRLAVPNSIRVRKDLAGATGFALELVPTVDGGRYCVSGDANCALRPGDPNLDVSGSDTGFDILGCFRDSAFTTAAAGGTTAYRLVINNSTATEIYGATGAANQVMSPAGSALTLSVSPEGGSACGTVSADPTVTNVHHLAIGGGYDFLSDSPRRRVFVVRTNTVANAAAGVTYVCDTTAGTLTRYAGYGIQGAQPNQPGTAPLSASIGSLVAQNVSACDATDTGNIQGVALVTLDLSVSRSGETVRLVHQVQLDNSE